MSEKKDNNTDWFARIIALLSLTGAIVGIVVSARSCHNSARLGRLHVSPEIEVHVSRTLGRDRLHEAVVLNRGPIAALNVAVYHDIIFVRKDDDPSRGGGIRGRRSYSGDYDPNSDSLIKFVRKLDVGKSVREQLLNIPNKDPWVGVIRYGIHWYREPDMKQFEKQVLFFGENGDVFNHRTFRQKPYYSSVMEHYQAARDEYQKPKYHPVRTIPE